MKPSLIFSSLALVSVSQNLFSGNMSSKEEEKIPNIILIMCDDMGFSDLSCYGGEVHTPNIDYLAENGVRFSQFKNAGRSCPSRASLLTGRYSHEAGIGWMTAVDEHRAGYRGQLSASYPTIAEILKDNGYATCLSGKWHVTLDGAYGQEPNGSYPLQRGFDKYYGSLSGGGSYYAPTPLYSNSELITGYPEDYYYTTAITDSAVSFIQNHHSAAPLFMYLAHYAPHRPLQAPKERIDACRERYKVGYDVLRQQRFDRLKSMGITDTDRQDVPLHQTEFQGKRPSWNSLTSVQQGQWITDMSTYAAMIEIMDDGIGEVIRATKEQGMFDNTVFIFLSDNGSTLEGGLTAQLMADLSNTPYRSYKQWCFLGGTSTPFILMYGGESSKIKKGSICNQTGHIIDLLPTCLDFASVKYPRQFRDQKIDLPDGISILPAIENKKMKSRDLFFEHQTSCAVISDSWKLVRNNGKQPWELINLTVDPFEQQDVAAQYPDKVNALEKKWNKWAEQQHVFPFEYRSWGERINYYKSLNSDQSGK